MEEFIISDHLITNGEDAALYKLERLKKKDKDKPAFMRWKTAADFCNKLSQKMGLEPCYYGLEYECNFENNGWRIPSLEELKTYSTIGNQWEWTNDEGEWPGKKGRIRVTKDEYGIYATDYDPDEKYPFRICRFKSTEEIVIKRLLICAADKQWTAIDVNADGDCDRISFEGNQAMTVESNEAVSEFCAQILDYYNIEKFSDIELNIKIVAVSEYSNFISDLFLRMKDAKSINVIDAKCIIPVYVLKKCIVKPDSVIDVRCLEKRFTLKVDDDLLVSYADGKAGEEIVMEPEDFSILFRFDCRNLISDENELNALKRIAEQKQKEIEGYKADIERQKKIYDDLKPKYNGEMARFSVGKGKKVHFSKGNLYYDGSAFKFETNQYDFADSWNPSHVSHFYWSKTDSVAYAEKYSDGSVSIDDVFFTNETTKTANPNFTVNGEKGKWRTLSGDEWKYLIETRTMTNGKARYSNAVSGVTIGDTTYKGVFIYPDNYNGDVVSSTMTWDQINAAGIVFLPAAGVRIGFNVLNVGYDAIYWSATPIGDIDACDLYFFSSGMFPAGGGVREDGYAVRLVCDEN